jgi:hypothetical protein
MLGYVRSVLDLAAKTSDSVVCVKYASLFKKIAKHSGDVAAVWGDQIVELFLGAEADTQKGDACDRLRRNMVARAARIISDRRDSHLATVMRRLGSVVGGLLDDILKCFF